MFLTPGSRAERRPTIPIAVARRLATAALIDTSGVRGYLGGLGLSNDGVTPNTVLDIAAGSCIDSTNAVVIKLGVFTKTTAGPWAAGSGNAGMAPGISVLANTWYHVFAIINNGAADVYFDSSISNVNKPTNTTALRRIGSFRTDGATNIITFTQNGDEFLWLTPVTDINAVATSVTAASRTLTVPTGVRVNALFNAQIAFSTAGAGTLFYALDTGTQADFGVAGNRSLFVNNATVTAAAGSFNLRTNTSAQIGWVSSATGCSVSLATLGWIDRRGRDG